MLAWLIYLVKTLGSLSLLLIKLLLLHGCFSFLPCQAVRMVHKLLHDRSAAVICLQVATHP